jgi:hypothetical protein
MAAVKNSIKKDARKSTSAALARAANQREPNPN